MFSFFEKYSYSLDKSPQIIYLLVTNTLMLEFFRQFLL